MEAPFTTLIVDLWAPAWAVVRLDLCAMRSNIGSALAPTPQCVRSVTAERPYSNEAALMRAIS